MSRPRNHSSTAILIVLLAACILVPAVAGADADIVGYLGDAFTLYGESYVGDSVYLFMTGPGLPANGVTLTDISLRADQGHFTVVDVDENQEWTYTWKTSRIDSEIDAGTYIVYVTNKPLDLSHLGSENSYKTYSFFLKDSGVSKVSIDAQHAYTRNPEDRGSTPRPAPSINLTSTTPTAALQFPLETVAATPVPTTRAGTGPSVAVTALLYYVCLVSFLKARY